MGRERGKLRAFRRRKRCLGVQPPSPMASTTATRSRTRLRTRLSHLSCGRAAFFGKLRQCRGAACATVSRPAPCRNKPRLAALTLPPDCPHRARMESGKDRISSFDRRRSICSAPPATTAERTALAQLDQAGDLHRWWTPQNDAAVGGGWKAARPIAQVDAAVLVEAPITIGDQHAQGADRHRQHQSSDASTPRAWRRREEAVRRHPAPRRRRILSSSGGNRLVRRIQTDQPGAGSATPVTTPIAIFRPSLMAVPPRPPSCRLPSGLALRPVHILDIRRRVMLKRLA